MTDWRAYAKCLGMDAEVFFPAADSYPSPHAAKLAVREAKGVCGTCRVRQPCLEENIHERFGVWGGTTPDERARLRRRSGGPEEAAC